MATTDGTLSVIASRRRGRRAWYGFAVLALLALLAAPLGSSPAGAQDAPPATPLASPAEDIESVGGSLRISGSSTVYPLTTLVAETFNELAGDAEIEVTVAGTGGGFDLFCAGETDIQNASRAIDEEEMADCAEQGAGYYAFQVAVDGISIVVHPDNDFVDCLSVEQLAMLWREDDRATTWQDLDPAWPDDEIALYGPDDLSGTYDYFTEVTLGGEPLTTDYTSSPNDFILAEQVALEPDGLAFFGYSYYAQNQDTLRVVPVDAGASAGCVAPSVETIQDLSYQPYSRPLYIYVDADLLTEDRLTQEFVRYYLANAATLAPEAFIVPAARQVYTDGLTKLAQAMTGAIGPDG